MITVEIPCMVGTNEYLEEHPIAANDLAPTFTQSEKMENIVSGEAMTVLMGKIQKSMGELIQHLTAENPHNNAPAYSYGMEDMTAGVSTLKTGTMYLVYE